MDKRRVNVRAIIWSDGKLLAVKHKASDGSESKYWAVPGGGLDPMESVSDGMVRELHEELGIPAKVGKLLFVQQFRSERSGWEEELELFFHVENSEDFHTFDLANTSHGFHELARVEFIDPSAVHILPAFLQTVDIADYIANERPVYIHSELAEPRE